MVVVDGETVVIVVGGGVELEVVVESVLVVFVDAVVFWHPMIQVSKTRLNRTRRKPEYLLFINALLYSLFSNLGFQISLNNSRANIGFPKAFTKLLLTPSVPL